MPEPSPPPVRSAPVTVVVPAYQSEGTVAVALASVAGQTAAPVKVVVVDDGSSDGTADAARAAMPGATVITQANAGPSAARNRALEEVDTPWVAFLDADDRWHREKLADQLEAAGRHPHAVVVASDWVRDELAFPPKPAQVTETVFDAADLLVLNRFQTSTALCRTEVVRALGGFRSELDGVEDWDMWWRLSE
ncbi:MAG TPA: glycosyltransferase family 2 protein, partial [Acidimicrobiales bacterium]|nr:glycosyltransferase family 2 protein [Acidimicrobiales bacterium]